MYMYMDVIGLQFFHFEGSRQFRSYDSFGYLNSFVDHEHTINNYLHYLKFRVIIICFY